MQLSSRTRAIALAAMTAGAAITGFAHPASAEDAKVINVATTQTETSTVPSLGEFIAQCDKVTNPKYLQCVADQTKAHTAALRLVGRSLDQDNAKLDRDNFKLDKRLASLNDEGVCLDMIMKDLMAGGKKTASLTAPPPDGQACKIARDLKL